MKNLAAVAIAVGGLAAASPAQAVLLQYELSGDYSASWQLDSNVVPDEVVFDTLFVLFDVEGFPELSSGVADLYFYNSNLGGGLSIEDFGGEGFFVDTLGPQLYTGTEFTPTLQTGVFNLQGFSGQSYTLTVTEAGVGGAVPEPASWAMMLLGFGFVGGALRARRRSERVTFTFAS